uniref:Uncharacterized protein n=1 Tax=viral metagenome TaxID=1070528 RepID=A0A6C0F912_9ZZZZ|tara:strand:- start:12670 stop:13032 length:363 start_codon:yes stop_codon:yes gene_type:complete
MTVIKSYCNQVYNTELTDCNLSMDEQKLIEAIERLKISQKVALEKRKCIIFLKNYKDAPPMTCNVPNINTKEKQSIKPVIKEITKVVQCKAICMNGKQCSSKAKYGEFCGRHKPKPVKTS